MSWLIIKRKRLTATAIVSGLETLPTTIPDIRSGSIELCTANPQIKPVTGKTAKQELVYLQVSRQCAWVWYQVRSLLEAQGHTVRAAMHYAHGLAEPPQRVRIDQITLDMVGRLEKKYPFECYQVL